MGNLLNKIICFIDTQLNNRYYKLFGIDILIKNGFNVEVWDFSGLIWEINPERFTEEKFEGLDSKSIIYLNSKNEAKSSIHQIPNDTLILTNLRFDSNTYWVYRSLSRKKLNVAGIYIGSLPNFTSGEENSNMALSLILHALSIGNYKILYRYIKNQITYRILRKTVKPCSYIVADALMAELSRYPISIKTKIIWTHTMDYESYLLYERDHEHESRAEDNEKIAVFLDQWFPFHNDSALIGTQTEVTAENYYKDLNHAFRFLENNGYTVKIAAHPKALYDQTEYKEKDYYQGRVIEKNNTLQMVKKSELVICHLSLAINFAVLYKKPVLFVTTDEINKTYHGKNMDLFAKALGKNVVNAKEIDETDIHKELLINNEKYSVYMENYIKKKGTPEKEIWQIFIDEIKQGGENHL